jgi:lysozyme
MNLDPLKSMLTRHEGRRKKKYRCSRGKWTIGVGWNMDAWPLPADIDSYLRVRGEITEGMIDRLLDISITTATNNCRDIYPGFDGFSETRRFALIDLCFNLGVNGLLKFKKAMAAIKIGDWNEAANQFCDSDWFTQVGVRGPEIVGMIRNG